MKNENLRDRKDIKDDVWFEMYGQLTSKFEGQYEKNEKLQKEIMRRVDRFNQNERLYREEMKMLQRELRVRYGYENHAAETNNGIARELKHEIKDAIKGHDSHVKHMENE